MHPLREVFGGNCEAGNVAAWICKLAECQVWPFATGHCSQKSTFQASG